MLQAEIDQLRATVAKLTEDISELTVAVADLDSAIARQTKLRHEEKAKNTETISDAASAGTAVDQALAVLREFYVKAGEATAFVQKAAAPDGTYDSAYKGMDTESDAVLGMLEVIQTDFARLESATKTAEVSAQHEYDEFMTDSKTDKEAKATNLEHKATKKQDTESAFTTKSHDLVATQKELDAAFVYFDKLKPSCVDAGDDFNDRVVQRKEEIASLQEALRALNGEDLP